MDLQEYYHTHPEILENKAYLEKLFLDSVFFQEFGNDGLDFLQYQKEIYDPNKGRHYRIDFVIEKYGRKIAIETDGFNYHIPKTREEFEYQIERSNEITRQRYEPVHYTHDKIKYHPDEVRKDLRDRLSSFSIPYTPIDTTPPTSPDPIPDPIRVEAAGPKTTDPPKPSGGTTIYGGSSSSREWIPQTPKKSSNSCGKTVLLIIIILIVLYLINSGKQNSSSTSRHTFSNTATKPVQTQQVRPSATPSPTRLSSFMNHKLSIKIGQTVTLSYDPTRFPEQLIFDTSPKGIIKVQKKSDNHTLTVSGAASGTADILMKDRSGNVIDTCKVTVKQSTPTPIPIREWSFEKDKLNIKAGESVQLKFNKPANAYFYFTTSNDKIRTDYVPGTDYILITGLLPGTCTISLISDIGSAADTCTVTISAK